MAAEMESTTERWKLMKEIYDKEGLTDNLLTSIITDPVKYCQECCLKNCPHIKELQFLLFGSKKEGGSETCLFSGKTPYFSKAKMNHCITTNHVIQFFARFCCILNKINTCIFEITAHLRLYYHLFCITLNF